MIEDTDKLLTRPPLPSAARLSGRKFGLVTLTAFGLLLVYLFLTLSARQRGRTTPQPPPKPGVYEVSGTPEPDVALKLQTSYAGWNREPPAPAKPVELPQPMFSPMATTPAILPPLPPAPKDTALPPTPPCTTAASDPAATPGSRDPRLCDPRNNCIPLPCL